MSERYTPQDHFVVKSNRFVTARYDWGLVEQKIVLSLIAQLRKDDEEFDYQRVRMQDIAQVTGTAPQNLYAAGPELATKIASRTVEARNDEDEFHVYTLMSDCRYLRGEGVLLARFNPNMRPLLMQLKKRFTMYRLQFAMRLTSHYSIRLYELIKMREELRSFRVTVENLRAMLMVEDKYERFTDLKKHVILPARNEIKKKCDVYFTFNVEREGRTPVRIRFMIHPNTDVDAPVKKELVRPERAPTREMEEVKPAEDVEDVSLDAKTLFLGSHGNEELNQLTSEDIQQIYDKAVRLAREQNTTGISKNMLAVEVYKVMNRIFKEDYVHRAEAP